MSVITRVAGTGTAGNSGDGGLAAGAQLNNPARLAVTGDGGFLIADFGNHVVRKASADGMITRVAGSVRPGNSGDDGRATYAQLAWPEGVAVTGYDGFLVADFGSHVVRKVSAGGVITRVAGTSRPGNTGDDGPAIDAQLNNPAGLAAARAVHVLARGRAVQQQDQPRHLQEEQTRRTGRPGGWPRS
jgi:hypothetical protein